MTVHSPLLTEVQQDYAHVLPRTARALMAADELARTVDAILAAGKWREQDYWVALRDALAEYRSATS